MLALILPLMAAAAQTAPSPEQTVLDHLTACKTALKASRDPDKQTQALDRLKQWLAGDARKLSAAAPGAQRKLRMTLAGLKIYLEPVQVSEAANGHCTRMKDRILDSVDPHQRPPSYLPGEAEEALTIVDLLCANRP